MLYLFLGLKIPLLLLYWLVYWAIKAEPEPEDAGSRRRLAQGAAAPRPDRCRAPRAAARTAIRCRCRRTGGYSPAQMTLGLHLG